MNNSNNDRQFKLPVSGGNIYVASKQMEAQEKINEMYKVPAMEYSGIGFINQQALQEDYISKVQVPTYEDWFLLTQECQYFSNLFDIVTDNYNVKQMWKLLNATLFFYGSAAVEKIGDSYIVYCLTGDIERNGSGYPIKAKGLVSFLALSEKIKPSDLRSNEIEGVKVLEGDSVVFFKYNLFEYSAWITIAPYLRELQSLLTMGKVASYMLAKKLKYTENNELGTNEELNAIFNPNLPYLKVKGINVVKKGGAILENRIEEFKTTSGNTKDITDYIDWHTNYWYSRIGRRTNINEKTERNINSEVMTSQNNFDVLENEWRDWLEIGIFEMNKKFGINVELGFIQTTKQTENNVEDNSIELESGIENDI